MRILLVIRSLEVGGTERQLVELAKALHQKQHSVRICTFYSGGYWTATLAQFGIEVVSLKKRSRWNLIQPFRRLMDEVRNHSPDIVYSFLVEPNIFVLPLKFFFPKTRLVWGIRASNMETTQAGSFSALTFGLSRFFSRFPDRIIANSESGKSYHAGKGYPDGKIAVVENIVDASEFFFDETERASVRKKIRLNANEILIGHVGRIDPIKDQKTLLRAYEIFRRKAEIGSRLALIGSGDPSLEQELKTLAQDLGISAYVDFIHAQKGLRSWYSAMDVFVSSSRSEGFSNTIAEALMCGTPCVVTDVGDSARMVVGAGKAVPAGDEYILAEAVLHVHEVFARSLSREGIRMSFLQRYGADALFSRHEALLETLIQSEKN